MANPRPFLSFPPLSRLWPLLLLLNLLPTVLCRSSPDGRPRPHGGQLISLAELDSLVGPYAVEWPPAKAAENANIDENGAQGEEGEEEEWTPPEALRLKRWRSTHLRFGKRATPERKQWASQVRFGKK